MITGFVGRTVACLVTLVLAGCAPSLESVAGRLAAADKALDEGRYRQALALVAADLDRGADTLERQQAEALLRGTGDLGAGLRRDLVADAAAVTASSNATELAALLDDFDLALRHQLLDAADAAAVTTGISSAVRAHTKLSYVTQALDDCEAADPLALLDPALALDVVGAVLAGLEGGFASPDADPRGRVRALARYITARSDAPSRDAARRLVQDRAGSLTLAISEWRLLPVEVANQRIEELTLHIRITVTPADRALEERLASQLATTSRVFDFWGTPELEIVVTQRDLEFDWSESAPRTETVGERSIGSYSDPRWGTYQYDYVEHTVRYAWDYGITFRPAAGQRQRWWDTGASATGRQVQSARECYNHRIIDQNGRPLPNRGENPYGCSGGLPTEASLRARIAEHVAGEIERQLHSYR